MTDRSFKFYDASLIVSAPGGEPKKQFGLRSPDWETFNRLLKVLEGKGFAFTTDPRIDERYAILSKYHRLGSRQTPQGELFVAAECYPTGCKLEFFQEIVTENHNGGRHDFDKRRKMPYLIGKAFEVAANCARDHLLARGFEHHQPVKSPNPDPLAFFNDKWDGEYERKRGIHRFKRDESGWPDESELRYWRHGAAPVQQGDVWYFRDHGGHLMRGRCYGGINGMWMVIYGPGAHDCRHLHRSELFQCSPAQTKRRDVPVKRGISRLTRLRDEAIRTEDYEAAARYRDALRRISTPELEQAA